MCSCGRNILLALIWTYSSLLESSFNIFFPAESCGVLNLKNAIKAFENLKMMDCYRSANLSMISLSENLSLQEQLNQYIEILKVARF